MIDIIVALSRKELLGVEGQRVLLVISIMKLEEVATFCKVAGIGPHFGPEVGVEVCQYRGTQEPSFEFSKGFLTWFCPVEIHLLLQLVCQ